MASPRNTTTASLLFLLLVYLVTARKSMATDGCSEKNALSSSVTRLNSGHNIPLVSALLLKICPTNTNSQCD